MSKKKQVVIENGFAGLKSAFQHLHLEVPKLDKDLLTDPSRHDEVVKEKVKGVGQIQKSMNSVLKYLDSAAMWVAGHEDRLERKIAQQEVAKDMEEAREHVSECLSVEEPIYRTAAAIAYLKYAFSLSFATQEDARAMLQGLVDRGLLVKTTNDPRDPERGPIFIGYEHFKFGDFGLDPEDKAEIQNAINEFSRSFSQLISQERVKQTKAANEEADIDLEDLVEGGDGKCLLEVPPESYLDRQGEEQWRGGGNVLVQALGKEILPLVGIGSLASIIASMKAKEVKLGRHTLEWETPPGYGKSFARVVAGVMDTRGLLKAAAEDYVKKLQALWHIIRRAREAVVHQKELAQLKEEFLSRADITAEQFFGLNGNGTCQKGTSLLEFKGAFKGKKGKYDQPSVYNLFFLCERTEEAGKSAIKIVDAPKHVRKFLAPCIDKEYAEGDNFNDLPRDLGRILRGIRGQVEKAAEVAAKE